MEKRKNVFNRQTVIMYAEEIAEEKWEDRNFNLYTNRELEDYLETEYNEYKITD